MGLFSKFLGEDLQKKGKALGEQLEGQLGSAVRDLLNGAKPAAQPQRPAAPAPSATAAPARPRGYYDAPPAEENSFTYEGAYEQYFSEVFRSAFPEYAVKAEPGKALAPSTVFRFGDDGRALTVEVMSERSASNRLRRICEAEHIPYLRFYHDHWGWWNTRSYVVERTAAALGR